MADDTSPAGGATPPSTSPATGNAPGSATPPAASLTLEGALKRIAELEQHAQNKTEEASRHGSRLTAAEKELAAYKEKERLAQEATLSETERLQQQFSDQQQINEQLAIELFERYVHEDVATYAGKLNFLDGIPPAMLARMIDWDDIEEVDGRPSNVEKLLEKLAKAVPVLTRQQQAGQQQGAPAIPGMNPGRSSIQPPGQGSSTLGKRPSWSDVEWKR